MSDAPAWAQPEAPYEPPAPPGEFPADPSSKPGGPQIAWQGAAAGFASQAVWNEYGGQSQMDKEQEIPRKVRYLIQFFHALTAVFVGLAAFINIINADTLGAIVLCVYLFCFGGMICAFETPLKVVNNSLAGCCGFMEHAGGRFFFLLLVGTLALSFGVWGIVGGCCAFAGAALNVYAAVAFQNCMTGARRSDRTSSSASHSGGGFGASPYYEGSPSHNPMAMQQQQQPGAIPASGNSWAMPPNDKGVAMGGQPSTNAWAESTGGDDV